MDCARRVKARDDEGRRASGWREEWGGRRGRVLDAPLLVLDYGRAGVAL